ncbi:uncharacterized protein [Macrobrachium rosenbergii]|uniref:uncharacterized protein isoform X3 n=1 Tax=Macrobrachium rosenbergii TaxID=79674 RepID=UPI0034D44FE2
MSMTSRARQEKPAKPFLFIFIFVLLRRIVLVAMLLSCFSLFRPICCRGLHRRHTSLPRDFVSTRDDKMQKLRQDAKMKALLYTCSVSSFSTQEH